ncbi:hypothetical protein [Sandarakinorhabdus limnophila]|jgi:hypothetical protein|uniref:hypothetical protein n=1 Tax=Sandarakinorhabdus limnophila TaxID=210512 RepID=UPI0026EF18F6|nr:hypothetical protein [Sandarakinorhabdus limnophila]
MEQRAFILAEMVQHEERWHQTQDPRAILACFDICAANGMPVPNWAQPTIRKAIALAKNDFGYGGFEVDSGSEDDPDWTKLDTVAEHLEAGEALPPFLARWLGNAIDRAGRDPNELLRLLELKPCRGRPRHRFTAKDEWTWGAKICELEDEGSSPEAALEAVSVAFSMALKPPRDPPERSQLQRWREKYRRAMEEAEAATK